MWLPALLQLLGDGMCVVGEPHSISPNSMNCMPGPEYPSSGMMAAARCWGRHRYTISTAWLWLTMVPGESEYREGTILSQAGSACAFSPNLASAAMSSCSMT